ncbi:lipid A-modifier LpxR family protein [Brevundimonas sp.]|uniref:lipid A-modifier LpxR family protein n=1 Tax=Brevundimonas sp. TaxID=1871086 RepID=UPI0025D6C70F|nr:lipid A-modifier LpxR family protein [Brevundimonas sp.]
MRFDVTGGLGVIAAAMAVCAADSALAQSLEQDSWAASVPVQITPGFAAQSDAEALELQGEALRLNRALFENTPGFVASQTRGVWRQRGDGSIEQIRVRWYEAPRETPLPTESIQRARLERDYDVTYVRGWPMVSGEPGAQVEFTPHAGVGVGSEGGTAEVGATIRVGDLEVRDGRSYEDDQGRWYLFAAGTRRAVGLNFARGMDGGWAREGVSHDTGAFIGDAQIGVAWRRGDTQSSFGYVHREITAEGVHGGTGIDRDVTEGFVAFQFSVRPDW